MPRLRSQVLHVLKFLAAHQLKITVSRLENTLHVKKSTYGHFKVKQCKFLGNVHCALFCALPDIKETQFQLTKSFKFCWERT